MSSGLKNDLKNKASNQNNDYISNYNTRKIVLKHQGVKLDEKDLKILQALDLNAKASITSIASELGFSKEVVNYRIKNLERSKVIKKYTVITDLTCLGFNLYRLLINLYNISPRIEQDLQSWLKRNPRASWFVKLQGNWDLALLSWSRNPLEFQAFYESLITRYGNFFKEKAFSIVTKILVFNYSYIHKGVKKHITIGGCNSRASLNHVEKEILKLLMDNARMSHVDIGKALGITANTVKYHIKRLEDSKIIKGYKLVLNHELLGFEHYKVMIQLSNLKKKEVLKSRLMQEPTIVYITESFGHSDLEFEMHAPYARFVNEYLTMLRTDYDFIKDFEIIPTTEEVCINKLPF
ncbi:Lrp/AsnC family transcriptional regulator [Candidatus Woesearchaeota archaeon]|nr:Lrp/AsnC family transcriptional regulator [Candidatus Woesearchaeota archaeon]